MDVEIDIGIGASANAERYFESSKKAKKKMRGTREAVDKLRNMEAERKPRQTQKTREERKRAWFQNYRWFYTSRQNLAIGGRDAQTNEEIIKKHTERGDLVFHADLPGSPFFVIKGALAERKSDTQELIQKELSEAADATASFSKAWGAGASHADVYYVQPDQVSKSAKAGEYLTKGSFMIYGKKNYLHGKLSLFARVTSLKAGQHICVTPVESQDNFAMISPGTMKSSDAAKEILSYLNRKGKSSIIIDEIQSAIPGGGIRLEFTRKQN